MEEELPCSFRADSADGVNILGTVVVLGFGQWACFCRVLVRLLHQLVAFGALNSSDGAFLLSPGMWLVTATVETVSRWRYLFLLLTTGQSFMPGRGAV